MNWGYNYFWKHPSTNCESVSYTPFFFLWPEQFAFREHLNWTLWFFGIWSNKTLLMVQKSGEAITTWDGPKTWDKWWDMIGYLSNWWILAGFLNLPLTVWKLISRLDLIWFEGRDLWVFHRPKLTIFRVFKLEIQLVVGGWQYTVKNIHKLQAFGGCVMIKWGDNPTYRGDNSNYNWQGHTL